MTKPSETSEHLKLAVAEMRELRGEPMSQAEGALRSAVLSMVAYLDERDAVTPAEAWSKAASEQTQGAGGSVAEERVPTAPPQQSAGPPATLGLSSEQRRKLERARALFAERSAHGSKEALHLLDEVLASPVAPQPECTRCKLLGAAAEALAKKTTRLEQQAERRSAVTSEPAGSAPEAGGDRRCLHCGGPHPVSDAVFQESPFCANCLNERIAARVERNDKLERIGELLKQIEPRDFAGNRALAEAQVLVAALRAGRLLAPAPPPPVSAPWAPKVGDRVRHKIQQTEHRVEQLGSADGHSVSCRIDPALTAGLGLFRQKWVCGDELEPIAAAALPGGERPDPWSDARGMRCALEQIRADMERENDDKMLHPEDEPHHLAWWVKTALEDRRSCYQQRREALGRLDELQLRLATLLGMMHIPSSGPSAPAEWESLLDEVFARGKQLSTTQERVRELKGDAKESAATYCENLAMMQEKWTGLNDQLQARVAELESTVTQLTQSHYEAGRLAGEWEGKALVAEGRVAELEAIERDHGECQCVLQDLVDELFGPVETTPLADLVKMLCERLPRWIDPTDTEALVDAIESLPEGQGDDCGPRAQFWADLGDVALESYQAVCSERDHIAQHAAETESIKNGYLRKMTELMAELEKYRETRAYGIRCATHLRNTCRADSIIVEDAANPYLSGVPPESGSMVGWHKQENPAAAKGYGDKE